MGERDEGIAPRSEELQLEMRLKLNRMQQAEEFSISLAIIIFPRCPRPGPAMEKTTWEDGHKWEVKNVNFK